MLPISEMPLRCSHSVMAGRGRDPATQRARVCGRKRVVIAAAGVFAASLVLAPLARSESNSARDISGVWQSVKYSPKLEIVGGGDIPYNDKGRALYAANLAGLKDGSIRDEARHLCVPDGLPRIL